MREKRWYFDGGYGSLFQERGLLPGELPESWNHTHEDTVVSLHREYIEAGCEILKTNTFGANRFKWNGEELEGVISKAVELARRAVAESGRTNVKIALDVGPTGKLLQPLGDLSFEDAVDAFRETIAFGVAQGVDLILIETMNDSLETKAAVLAAKETCDLPIFVTNAYDENGKLMTGATPAAMVAMLEGLGVDALGINCSLGPEQMLPVVEELLACASIPVIVNPNAGLPVLEKGKTTYTISPDEFSDTMQEMARMGVSVLGGCCGTTPSYIRAVREKTEDLPFSPPTPKKRCVVSSYASAVTFGEAPVLIGERINPTGKKRFQQALREGDDAYLLQEAIAQQEAGAHILDVNVGLPELEEETLLPHAVQLIQGAVSLPLQMDTANPRAMEAALRVYNGKALINSVNGKQEVMDQIFPLAARYGGVVVALTLDENGIPETVEGRMAIVDRILARAAHYGLSSNDLLFDPLAMAVSSDAHSAQTTLCCIRACAERGLQVSLGVSNISFGLPNRPILNATFFAMALENGLSAAIMNPHSKEMMDVYYSFCALRGLDDGFGRYIAYGTQEQESAKASVPASPVSAEEGLFQAVLRGIGGDAKTYAGEAVKKLAPLDVVDRSIIPALNEIGKRFEEKTAFLPQLLLSAEAAKAAFEVVRQALSEQGGQRERRYPIVLATVQGDIHDIGKNIVKVLLENYNFQVIDLGKDVPPERIVEAAKEHGAPLVGLSALMTTTVPAMEETVRLLQDALPACRVVVGGAVLNEEYARAMGADCYARDAMETVRYAQSLEG